MLERWLGRKRRMSAHSRPASEAALQSMRGAYFIGQTDALRLGGQERHAWGALTNPESSKVRLVIDRYIVSNLSRQPITAELWLNARPPGRGEASQLAFAAKLGMNPAPRPNARVEQASETAGVPLSGVHVASRIAPPTATVTSEAASCGIVLPPGGSLLILLKSPGPFEYDARIGFQWWEADAGMGGAK